MPTFYNFTQDNIVYSFDDIFVPAEAFREGNLWTWGRNNYAQLGTNDGANRSTPVTVFNGGVTWKQASCGQAHTAAIKTDGTLWNWGRNGFVQLGTNDGVTKSTPVTTFAGGTNWKQVSASDLHTAAIKTDGTLWVWGRNNYLQLGTNDNIVKSTPVTTFAGGTNWKQVFSGNRNVLAVKTDGTLWGWGQNNGAQLGTNDAIPKSTPVTTFAGGTNWKQVSCGIGHGAAIKTDGTLWVWGSNASGQLGTNNVNTSSTPVTTFAGGTNWKQVSCGYRFTAVVKTDGTLWVWGQNNTAQLGINSGSDRSTPVTTFAGGTNWKQSAGYNQFLAIKTDGTLWVWGANANNQLGVNDTAVRSTPVTTFAGGSNWKQVYGHLQNSGAIQYY
jgi:alpha-tubulin suppressor-like RCC1 family protein